MSLILATTGSNALRHASAGLGVVRWWTYTKHPYGEAWESNFPTTIYLVGCGPPWSTSLYCSDEPTQKVVYRRGLCLTVAPASDYIYSWDRRSQCPWDDSRFCGDLEEPPDPGNIADGEESTIDMCIAYNYDPAQLLGPLFKKNQSGGYFGWGFIGFVEPDNRLDGGECVPKTYTDRFELGSYSDGKMTKNSSTSYTKSPITLTLNIEEGTAHANFSQMVHVVGYSYYPTIHDVYYSGEVDFAFDPETGGGGSIEVRADSVNFAQHNHGYYRLCPGSPECWGSWLPHPCPQGNECGDEGTCLAGSLGINVSITENEIC